MIAVLAGTAEREARPLGVDTEPDILEPTTFVQPDRRLFIDTNIFMDTDLRIAGGLKRLFERSQAGILQYSNPIIVPTKVVDELTKQSRLDPSVLSEERAEAVRKAGSSLVFLTAAEAVGLVRKDLGDDTNPYADDLFVEVFTRAGNRYEMCLLTHDITLQVRIRLLSLTTGKRLVTGVVTKDGLIEIERDQSRFERALRKLERMTRHIEEGVGSDKDRREIAVLQPLLEEYRRAFGLAIVAIQPGPRRVPNPRQVRGDALNLVGGQFAKAPRLKQPDHRLPEVDPPGHGDKVHFKSARDHGTLILGELLGEGGEGRVFGVAGDDTRVVKVFDDEHRTMHRQAKLELLMSRGLEQDGIAFPTSVVSNEDGAFLGYAMPRASGKELQASVMRPARFKKTYPHWSKADLVDVCISFLEKVSYLHSLNILLGDINPKNLMVDATKAVWIIDADSWQLEGYPCPVGTPMFTAPTVKGDYADRLRTTQEELFAVATMLFMILITGQFPYSRAGTDGHIPTLIAEGKFAFQFKGRSDQDQPEGNWKYMWSHLTPKVKRLFWHTFHRDGDRYTRRPSAGEWLQVFREYKAFFGSIDDYDPMSNDVYPFRFRAFRPDTPVRDCPQCKRSNAIVGEWDDYSKSYFTPEVCFDCLQNRPRCADCGKPKAPEALRDGRCWECNRKKADELDPSRLCTDCRQPFITFGHVDWYERKDLVVAKSHGAIKQKCPPSLPITQRQTKRIPTASTRKAPSSPPRAPSSQPNQPNSPAKSPSSQPKKALWARLFDWFWN